MSPHELCFMSAHDLTRAIGAKRVSCVEAIKAAIQRAEQLQPVLNCLAVPLYDEALQAARRADEAVHRKRPLGPLHGVPITIKDGIATAGHRMTMGVATHKDRIATTDDLVWTRLRNAGAILIGKTTTPEYFHKVLTDSPLFGYTRNPWSTLHSPGGSSGGAAAAVAAGIGVAAIGSDGGGSLRCPASCTNVLGLKPTLGRIPNVGSSDTFAHYAFTGPMARNVTDLRLVFAAMSGGHHLDVHSRESVGNPKPGGAPDHVRGLRIGWLAQPGSAGVDPAVARLGEEAIALLATEGAIIVPVDGAFLAEAFTAYTVIATSAHAARPAETNDTDDLSPSYKAIVAQGRTYTATDLHAANRQRTRLFRAVQALFQSFDLLAMPTLSTPPKHLDAGGAINTAMYRDWAQALFPFNLTGHPAASVPCGFCPDGLPVGLQIVGPWWGEDRILAAASCLQDATRWSDMRPPL